jgi:light-regulated signal transduction histidine kinase (bacteriophytochrome)
LVGIGETAGMVGHDLRNPLQSIVSDVYLIEEELKTLQDRQNKENIQESIQSIADQISYMNKIVSDLQTFVKPVDVKKELVNAKQLILNAMPVIEIPQVSNIL